MAQPRRIPPDRARRLAFDALRTVNSGGGYANLVLRDLLDQRRLEPRDAAFATELLFGTCRWQGSYDAIISAAAAKPITSWQPAAVDLLRLGTHQLMALRIPASAAVSATVDLAAATVGRRITGLINAVLRRVAARDLTGWLDDLTAGLDDRDALGLRTAHPRWVVDAYADLLPPEELEVALAANNATPVVTLAVRPGLCAVQELVAAGAQPCEHSPFGARWSGNPSDLAAIRDGRAGVQDEGSQLVAWAITRPPAPAGWWLDLCAGPGGKAALLAGLAASADSKVLAGDVSLHRAALVASAVRRYAGAFVVTADGTRPPWTAGQFSRVMADVPCTGLGALRRRPEVRWRRTPKDLEQLGQLQVNLLRSALAATSTGGVVTYVTCSPHRRETSDVVEQVIAGRSDFELMDSAELLPALPESRRGPYLQLWPHRHGTDAMFGAFLRRRR
ncbi:MAG TPA: transcription antitermination factor NusB [Propionibacteriaceae bacterium]|nr:transcription antitermination factor NusB [Propionibacteriaceae bacterium]